MKMKQYIGTKIIEARPGSMAEAQALKDNILLDVQYQKCEKAGIEDKDGYIVKYPDGYISWSPKDVFEEAYKLCDNMTFGLAIEAMKKGAKVARKGWNGNGMFIYIQEGSRVETGALRNLSVIEYCKSRVIQQVR